MLLNCYIYKVLKVFKQQTNYTPLPIIFNKVLLSLSGLIFYILILNKFFPEIMYTVLTYPKTLMFVSNTETTTSLSKETSLSTSLTAFSNFSTSPRTLEKNKTHNTNHEQIKEKLRKKVIQEMENEFAN